MVLFILICVIAFFVGRFMRSKMIVIVSVAIPATCLALTVFQAGMSLLNPFPYLREPPVKALVPGIYILDSHSFDYLKSRGFKDFSATIVLKENQTFSVTQMPHIWANGLSESRDYDTCNGSWSLGENASGHKYTLVFSGRGNVFSQGFPYMEIAAPKGNRKDYALIVPIFNTDFNYIYFVRKRD